MGAGLVIRVEQTFLFAENSRQTRMSAPRPARWCAVTRNRNHRAF
jgi:hypothetical protein